MFTGIVAHQVKILERNEKDGLLSFLFALPREAVVFLGASILINGVCSTVTKVNCPIIKEEKKEENSLNTPSVTSLGSDVTSSPLQGEKRRKGTSYFLVDYMPETRKKTTVDAWKTGETVHFETSLRVGDTIDGHFVFGHVDTTATVSHVRTEDDGAYDIMFRVAKDWMRYFVPKGSVAIDGTSLTVVNTEEDGFSVSLIPHTLKRTHLGALKPGSTVNIECDMLAKYAARALGK